MSSEEDRGTRVTADYTFCQTPDYLFRLGLKPTPLAVFAALHRVSDWKISMARTEHATIAEACSISESTVKRAIKQLEAVGAVTVVHRQAADGEHLANDYVLHMAGPRRPADVTTSDPRWVQKQGQPDPLLNPGGSKSADRSSSYRGSSSEAWVRGGGKVADAASQPRTQEVSDEVVDVRDRPRQKRSQAYDTTQRPDVDALCQHLAGRVAANGNRQPEISYAWRREARNLLDVDKVDPEEAFAVITWSQADPFWRTVVFDMPKFREKYDQLRMKANAAAAEQRATAIKAGTAPNPYAWIR